MFWGTMEGYTLCFVSFPAGIYLTIALQVSCLEEQPTSVKFDMLDRKSLYILVWNMAILQHPAWWIYTASMVIIYIRTAIMTAL